MAMQRFGFCLAFSFYIVPMFLFLAAIMHDKEFWYPKMTYPKLFFEEDVFKSKALEIIQALFEFLILPCCPL